MPCDLVLPYRWKAAVWRQDKRRRKSENQDKKEHLPETVKFCKYKDAAQTLRQPF